MNRWLLCGLALVLAVATALAIGWVRSDRLEPMVRHWSPVGEVVHARGSEFELVSLEQVDYQPGSSSDQLPTGAIVVQVELRQRVLEVPDAEYALSCSLHLVNGPDRWSPDTDLDHALDLSPNCHRTDDGPVIVGQERVISTAWVVPAGTLDGARVAMRFYVDEPVGIGFARSS